MLPWGAGGGRNNCFFEWCFLPLSICTGFYNVFRSFALFFWHHLRFPLVFAVFSGFMTLLMLRCTLGWGGVGQSRSCEVDHVVEASSCCWCYRGDVNVPCNLFTLLMLRHAGVGEILTFHVTCSRCWCYATLGWGDVNVPCNLLTLLMLRHAGVGGMLTFHVTCSRCWCYATLGWGGMLTVNVPCNLLTLLMLRHAVVGGCWRSM